MVSSNPGQTAAAGSDLRPDRGPGIGAGLAVALGLVAAAAVRLLAARGELWFDEIWSLLRFAPAVSAPQDLFTIHHDNHHHLVTLWLRLCGPERSEIVYRIPSLLAGIATVPLAALAARRWGRFEALAAGALAAGSLVLIQYASEARGYALAGAFALVAFLALSRALATGRAAPAAAFAGAVVLGFLSHLTFLFFYAGALAWSALAALRGPRSGALLAVCHLVPLVFLLWLYAFDVRHMVVGGGPSYPLLGVVAESLALLVGGTRTVAGDQIVAALALAAVGAGVASLRRQEPALATFFAVTLLAAPVLVLVVQRPPLVYPRYFYVPFVFLLLLVSHLLGRLARTSSAGRSVAVGLVVVLLLGNAWPTVGLLREGRGGYRTALAHMAERSPAATLQTDHDFEMEALLAFHAPRLPAGTRIVHVSQAEAALRAPEWLVVQDPRPGFAPHPELFDATGRRYVLDRVFPFAGLSGYHWAVYRRADP